MAVDGAGLNLGGQVPHVAQDLLACGRASAPPDEILKQRIFEVGQLDRVAVARYRLLIKIDRESADLEHATFFGGLRLAA